MKNITAQINDIFTKRIIFERDVLNVRSQKERSEIMHLLAKTIVRDTLKEHLNFLYINNMLDFTLKHVVNILFKEIASEWISYAIEVLNCSKDEALSELQDSSRVKFVHQLVESYYRSYKDYIYEEISNTFIELLASMNQDSPKILLVNAVINSDLIANRNIIGINSFDQLHRRIKSAKNLKSADVSYLQVKVSNILTEIQSDKTSAQKKAELSILLQKYEKKVVDMQNLNLEYFDESLKRVKRAMFNSLKHKIFKN